VLALVTSSDTMPLTVDSDTVPPAATVVVHSFVEIWYSNEVSKSEVA
jgi:hypothetical protein